MKTVSESLLDWMSKNQYFIGNDLLQAVEQSKQMEKIEKLKRQLFIGKVQEIIGFEKTIELLKECNETFKDAAL